MLKVYPQIKGTSICKLHAYSIQYHFYKRVREIARKQTGQQESEDKARFRQKTGHKKETKI